MQEQSDNEAANEGLDRLFRKSAEEFEPPFEPVAWQLMCARLDEHDRVTAWGRVLRGTLTVLALIVLLSGSWYVYKQNKVKTPSTQLEASQPEILPETLGETRMLAQRSAGREQSAEPVSPLVSDNGVLAVSSTNNSSKSIAPQSQQETAGRHIDNQPMEIETSQRRRLSWPVVRQPFSPEQVKKSSTNSVSRLKATTASERPASLKNGPEPTLRSLAKLQDKNLEPVAATSRPVSDQVGRREEMPGYRSINKTTADVLVGDSAMLSGELSRIGPLDALSSRDVMRWPQWSALTIPALTLPQAEPAVENTARPIRERGLSIRVVWSPDLSAVGIKNFTRPGTNYGFLTEYRFSKRLSVQAGLIQSKKVYTATPDQYAWPTNWKWYVTPLGVDGQCKMLDIPINVRYDFALRPMDASGLPAKRGPARWFVSSGVTTYIMQQEKYDYVYENPEDPRIRNRSWSGKTGRYSFSTLNLSVGYERPIGRRLAWQVEPFVKMPLKGVGQFKINLLSTGAFLSLRYRL